MASAIASSSNSKSLGSTKQNTLYSDEPNFLKRGTAPYQLIPLSNYSALAQIDPAKGLDLVKRDVTLDPGWTFTGTVLGPDGKPLAGARCYDVTGRLLSWNSAGIDTAEFTVRGFNPRRPQSAFFQHLEKGLIGVVQPPKANGGSVTVRLEPGAAVSGRLLDADGRPRAGVELNLTIRPKEGDAVQYPPGRIKTDQEGRFRIEALLPGCEFRLSEDKGELHFGALRSGQTKDLGDVQVKPIDP